MASDLVKVLIECQQPVPDFLEAYMPANGELEWNDDTDGEDPEDDGTGDAGWGAADDGCDDGWGAEAAPAPEQEPAADSWNAESSGAAW